MLGVREQQKSGDEIWFFGAEHAGLASAVGVAAQKDSPGGQLLQLGYGVLQSGAITGGVGRAGWAEGSCLAVG
jgi:hypothetical protein